MDMFPLVLWWTLIVNPQNAIIPSPYPQSTGFAKKDAMFAPRITAITWGVPKIGIALHHPF